MSAPTKKAVAAYLQRLLDDEPWLDSDDLTRAATEAFYDFEHPVPKWLAEVVKRSNWTTGEHDREEVTPEQQERAQLAGMEGGCEASNDARGCSLEGPGVGS